MSEEGGIVAFVYRYLHPDSDEIVYIGKTSGDLIESLKSRIAAHAAEYNFKKTPRAPAGKSNIWTV